MAAPVDLDRNDRLEREHASAWELYQMEEAEKARHGSVMEMIKAKREEHRALCAETQNPMQPLAGLGVQG